MEPWHDFLMAIAGASGALVGLLFVALSINLDQLMTLPHLMMRAASSLVALVSMLLISCLLLTPNVALTSLGAWVLAVGLVEWGVVSVLSFLAVKRSAPDYRRFQVFAGLVLQFATIPTVLEGWMLWQREDAGLLWLVPAFLLTFVVTMFNSWVLMVESRR